MSENKCPLCNMEFDYRVRHSKNSDWRFRDDVSVCSRPQGDQRIVYIHHHKIPVQSVAKTERKQKSKPVLGSIIKS